MTRETETVSFTYHTCDLDGKPEELNIKFDDNVHSLDRKTRNLSNFKAFDFDGSEIYDCLPFEKQKEIISLAINEVEGKS